jgi:hypothetical protein
VRSLSSDEWPGYSDGLQAQAVWLRVMHHRLEVRRSSPRQNGDITRIIV